ncbi:conserved protein of unknown function [uncultured Sphingopyxis sp.]|uniref:Uncharacterized protein n=1 Tax=uncultured Sphingopyxis sp. TaxID=310581 RepID=A0A1Y5Q085_9SPHN|nr:conserved protein of unknown function [uncultured Sphingopyxis sp.]
MHIVGQIEEANDGRSLLFRRAARAAQDLPERVKLCRMAIALGPRPQPAHRRQHRLARAGDGQYDVEAGLRQSGRTGDARKIGRVEVHATRLAHRA